MKQYRFYLLVSFETFYFVKCEIYILKLRFNDPKVMSRLRFMIWPPTSLTGPTKMLTSSIWDSSKLRLKCFIGWSNISGTFVLVKNALLREVRETCAQVKFADPKVMSRLRFSIWPPTSLKSQIKRLRSSFEAILHEVKVLRLLKQSRLYIFLPYKVRKYHPRARCQASRASRNGVKRSACVTS